MFKPFAAAVLTVSLLMLGGCGSTPGPKYRNVSAYSEGLAAVQSNTGKWGFINEHQQWVIQPRFEEARAFQAGKAPVKQDGKWGFINRRGEWQ